MMLGLHMKSHEKLINTRTDRQTGYIYPALIL